MRNPHVPPPFPSLLPGAGREIGASPLVPSAFIGRVLMLLRHRGVDARELMRTFRLPASAEQDPIVLFPLGELDAFARAAEVLADEPFLGIRAAEHQAPGMNGILAFACTGAPDAGAALRRYVEYFNSVHGDLTLSLEPSADGVALKLRSPGHRELMGRHANEQWVVAVVRASRELVQATWAPAAVSLAHEDASSRDELCRALGTARVTFGAGENALSVARRDLERPIRDSGSPLAAVLARYAVRAPGATSSTAGFRGRVREAMESLLPSGEPPINAVARLVGVSGRTLQRRLSERSLTFQGVLDDLRRDLAIPHVKSGKLPLEAVAELLGYSRATAFYRAFRRWTGTTPRALRAGDGPEVNMPVTPSPDEPSPDQVA